MKSEHRHELAENDLNKLITRGLKRIEPYQNQILLGMLAITVVVVSAVMLTRTSSAERSAGFAELVMCKTADDYLAVADNPQYAGEVATHWARLRAGEEYLREGIRLSISDRAQSTDRLEEAEEAFDILLHDQSITDEVREKALYGMAMTRETRADDTEGAIAAYQALIDEFETSRYRPIAEDRIRELGTDGAQQFYAWFQTQNPSPEDRPLPRDFPDPFGDMFDEDVEQEPGGLPPPPPTARRDGAATIAPEPPTDSEPVDGPALPGQESDAPDGAASAESTSEAVPESTDGPTLPASGTDAPDEAPTDEPATDAEPDPTNE